MAILTEYGEAATKAYVDMTSAGFNFKNSTFAATTAALTASYLNGASGVGATLTNAGAQAVFQIDGQSPAVGQRVLIKNQASTFQNGIYTVTNVGSVSTNWVLTRATDFDQPSEIQQGDIVPVINGTSNANSTWLQTAVVATIGVDPITFSQFSASPSTFLQVANNLSDLNNAATARTNLGLTAVATQSVTQFDVLVGGAANAITSVGPGSSGQVLQSSGNAANPAYSTATYPATTTINQLLYSSAANTVGGLATANSAALITSAGGVPSLSQTLPSAVQGNITSVGTITTGTWNGSILDLAHGGTNANLTASNGGIFYSTASAGAILSGTATARQMLQSGTSAAPAWSTATWPATTTASQLLYSSATNTVSGLATAANGVLVTDGSSVPSISSTLPTAVQGNITSTGNLGNQLNTTRCCFLVYMNTTTGSVTGDGTNYQIVFDTSSFDQNSNITLAGTTFTAPVTGKYLFNLNVTLGGIGTADSHTVVGLSIVTTGGTYELDPFSPTLVVSGTGNVGMSMSIIVPMTASNTAVAKVNVVGGAKNVTVVGSRKSSFSGMLVA